MQMLSVVYFEVVLSDEQLHITWKVFLLLQCRHQILNTLTHSGKKQYSELCGPEQHLVF